MNADMPNAPETIASSAYPASATGKNNAQYSIGIDLGTTHCALSYVDKTASDGDKVDQQVRALVRKAIS